MFRKYLTITTFIFIAVFGLTESNLAFQSKPFDLKQLRRAFIAEFDQDFQFIKGELKNHSVGKESQQYWLVHVKPKRTGFFTIKYAYQFADKFYAWGETEMRIGISGNKCRRYPQVVREIGYFCLGDTVIIPVRLHNFSKHTFSLKSKYAQPEEIEEARKNYYDYYLNQTVYEKVANPLEENIKYLGKYRADNLYRNGGGTFTHFAVFEAKSIGKFNIGLSFEGQKTNNILIRTTPVIIINPGTPIKSLVPEERATYFIKDRSYSSGYSNSFESNLLILQPGDVFAIPFSFFRASAMWEKNSLITEEKARNQNPTPSIHKQPFLMKTDEGFNDWVNEYLTK